MTNCDINSQFEKYSLFLIFGRKTKKQQQEKGTASKTGSQFYHAGATTQFSHRILEKDSWESAGRWPRGSRLYTPNSQGEDKHGCMEAH